AVFRAGILPDDANAVAALLPKLVVDLGFRENTQRVFLNGEDVSEEIRTPTISEYASKTSAIPEVRAFLLHLQRQMAAEHNVLMDGRDIGTVVLPEAQLKVFLTASPEVRAKRRYKELLEKGQEVSYESILAEVKARDYRDEHREIAPLKPAEDAVYLDTSEMSFEEVKNTLIHLAKETFS
ncbi:MAG TPA: (d)CMP kinase, partial [Clostridiales bacterium]|nr:(d)CMP kinase [Clostridiales bacterium]